MKARASRREVTKWMLSASIGGLAAAKLNAGPMAFHDSGGNVSFDPIRRRIQQAIAQGGATGVAVAVVSGGRIAWEEGFGGRIRKRV